MSKTIWIRDQQSTATVEWYVTADKKAEGVQNIREEWVSVPISDGKQTGFTPPREQH